MSSSKSSAAVGGNDNLAYEILSRLPSKSVIRFQIACKRWQSLTSTASFKTDHSRHRSSRAIPDLIIVHADQPARTAFSLDGGESAPPPPTSLLPDPSLSFLDREVAHLMRSNGFSVWSSCNGFLFCVHKTWIGPMIPTRCVFCVGNPTTMEVKKIRPPPAMTAITGAGLAFDPSISPHYKLVCLGSRSRRPYYIRNAPFVPHEILELATYSSETGDWEFNCNSSLSLERNCYPLYGEGRGVFWNGMINWVNPEERINWVNPAEEGCEDGFLLSFDPQRQLLRRAPLPALPHGFHRKILSFGESRGRLLLIEAHCRGRQPSDSAEFRFDIKEMDRDWSGWSLLYHVDLEAGGSIQRLLPDIYVASIGYEGRGLRLYPLHVLLQGGDAGDEDVLLLCMPRKIVSYGLGSHTFRVVCWFAAVKDERKGRAVKPWHVFPYSHTLLSP